MPTYTTFSIQVMVVMVIMAVEIAIMAEVTVFSSWSLQQQKLVNLCMSLKLFRVHMHLLRTLEYSIHHREQKTPIHKAIFTSLQI